MPYQYIYEKKHIPSSLDRRRKLAISEHDDIRKRNKAGESQRELARAYNVSRRLIVFILFPERLEKMKKKRKDTKYSQKYYHENMRDGKWREVMRKHRQYKQSIKHKLID